MRKISTTRVTSWYVPNLPLGPSHKSQLVGIPVLRNAVSTSQVKVSCEISRPRPPSAPSLAPCHRGHRIAECLRTTTRDGMLFRPAHFYVLGRSGKCLVESKTKPGTHVLMMPWDTVLNCTELSEDC